MTANAKAPFPLGINSAVEKSLLKLHSATDTAALWRAVQNVMNAALPGSLVGLTLQHSPVQPLITKWTQSGADGPLDPTPLTDFLRIRPRSRFIRASDLFPKRTQLIKSDFYRRYMEPRQRAHAVGLFFWRDYRLICVIVIMRSAEQGDFTKAQSGLLRSLYPQFQTALQRIASREQELSARMAFEDFIRRLPLPTILLRWNLQLIYQNQAARESCALWHLGPYRAQVLKAHVPVPKDILDGCRHLRRRWQQDHRAPPFTVSATSSWKTLVRHPKLCHLRANLNLRQINSLGLARPHFLIEFEELSQSSGQIRRPHGHQLSHLAQLSRRERQVTRLVCEGRSNQEIADAAKLSVAMVKKHLHSVFRKLEVSSRTRLITLMQ